jgi:hypothetical protein
VAWVPEQPAPGGSQGWGEPPAPARSTRRTPLLVGAGVAVLLVVAVAAILGLRDSGGQPAASPGTTAPFSPGAGTGTPGGGGSGGGVPGGGGSGTLDAGSLRLPGQVGGLARIPLGDPSLLDGQQGLLDLLAGSGALDGWGLGAYGPSSDDPRFVLLVVKARDASSAGGIAGAMVDAIRGSLGGDFSEPKAFTRNGVRYDCSSGSLGSLCSFQDGATIGLGFGRDADLGRLSQLTDEARRGVRG